MGPSAAAAALPSGLAPEEPPAASGEPASLAPAVIAAFDVLDALGLEGTALEGAAATCTGGAGDPGGGAALPSAGGVAAGAEQPKIRPIHRIKARGCRWLRMGGRNLVETRAAGSRLFRRLAPATVAA